MILLKRGLWGLLAIAYVAIVSLSLVAAAQSCAAALASSVVLRKLPPEDKSPGAQWARKVAQDKFPELFTRKLDGSHVVTTVFGYDGALLYAQKNTFPSTAIPAGFDIYEAARGAGADPSDVAYGGDEQYGGSIGPWLDTPNRVDVVYAVLKWPIDPSRSEARVRTAVRKKFPELFQIDAQQQVSGVYVFMDDEGAVSHARIGTEIVRTGRANGVDTIPGVDPQNIGRTGTTVEGNIGIIYAWPKRADDDLARLHEESIAKSMKQDTKDDRALIARYFPRPSRRTGERRWILFGRDGQVWGTGSGYYGKRPFFSLAAEMEARYPGIKVSIPSDGDECLGGTQREQQALGISCAWLAPTSSVSNLVNVDFSKRPDIFITAKFMGDRLTSSSAPPISAPYPVSLKFGIPGSPAFPLAALKQWWLTAHKSGKDQIEVTIQLQPEKQEAAPVQTKTYLMYGKEKAVSVGADHSATVFLRAVNLNPKP